MPADDQVVQVGGVAAVVGAAEPDGGALVEQRRPGDRSDAFRRPREVNWLIGVTLFALAAAERFLGYSLPDDALSGTGVRIAEGVLLSIPVVGTYITFFLFGGPYPGNQITARFYIIHVLLIPGCCWRRIRSGHNSATLRAPHSCIVMRSSWARMSMQCRTPASPAAASPYR
jgi:Cytochrome b(N-terminal)/b6/petB